MIKEQDNYNSNNEIRGPQLLLNVELLPEGLRGVPGENSDAGNGLWKALGRQRPGPQSMGGLFSQWQQGQSD